MSAIGGKADMTIALHMSAFDPKRTSTSSLKVVHFEQTRRPDRLTLSVEPKEIPALIGRLIGNETAQSPMSLHANYE
jgi:hypothetical protein